MKKKKGSIKNKIIAGILTIAMGLTSFGILSSCGQTNNPPVNDPPPIVNPTPAEEKVVVSSVVNDYFGTRNFANEFNSSLLAVASKKVDADDIKSVELVSFEKAKTGKIVLNVKYKDGLNLEDDELTYNGDTTAFEDFYNLSTNKTAVINAILADNEVSLTDEIVKDSAKHTAIKTDCADEIAKYDAQKTLFEGVSADSITVKEDPAPIVEYVTVQSLVDQVFAGINFDANLKETMKKIVQTRSATRDINKYLAFDFSISNSGMVTIIVDDYNTTTQSQLVSKYTINTDTTKLANYLTLSKDFEGMINKMLEDENVTLQTQIVKDSAEQNAILNGLNTLKTKYTQEKTLLESTAKTDIKASGLIDPAQFDSTKMQELGITSMNDFAKALLNNKKGEGYDQVTGWTMDDVIATYVGELSAENIEYKGSFDVVIVTKTGLIRYNVGTQRTYGDTTNRYSMFLSDNPNTSIAGIENLVTYSNNSIIYNGKEGQNISSTANPLSYVFTLDDKIIGLYDKSKDNKFTLF